MQVAGDGGAEEEMDPAELAAKMDGVRAWLETNGTLPQDQSESKGECFLFLISSLDQVHELDGIQQINK